MGFLVKAVKKLAVAPLRVLGIGGKKDVPPQKDPVPLLEGDEEELRLSRKKSIAKQRARSGRQSTILSQGGGGGFGG